MEVLRDFEWNINYLQWLLNSKIDQALSFPGPVQTGRSVERGVEQRIVFLEGEVLTFGGVSKTQVMSVLNTTGIPSDAYELTVDGPPLYFCSSFNRPDVEFVPPQTLRETDLPYGFAGPDGTFQFSSPEIEKLRKPGSPVEIDGVYTYFGNSTRGVDYNKCKLWEQQNDSRGWVEVSSIGWTRGNNKSEILGNIDTGKIAGTIVRNGPDTVYRDFTTNTESFKREIDELTSISTGCGVVGGLDSNNNPRPPVVGWKFTLGNPMGGHEIRANILQMPEEQLESFEVNPGVQQPYRGGEGVYPVVLVEFLRDVNVIF